MARHYQLIIVSNVHRDGFAGSNRQLRGDFAAIITAEDVGGYKPAENHFRALDATLAELGLPRTALLHAAQSLFHDHVAAKREGLPSVWINRRHDQPGWGATPQPSAIGATTWSSRPWQPSPTPSTTPSATGLARTEISDGTMDLAGRRGGDGRSEAAQPAAITA